jgi:hypothetical protein
LIWKLFSNKVFSRLQKVRRGLDPHGSTKTRSKTTRYRQMKIFNAVLRVLHPLSAPRGLPSTRPFYFSFLNVLCVENNDAQVCCIPGAPVVRLPTSL